LSVVDQLIIQRTHSVGFGNQAPLGVIASAAGLSKWIGDRLLAIVLVVGAAPDFTQGVDTLDTVAGFVVAIFRFITQRILLAQQIACCIIGSCPDLVSGIGALENLATPVVGNSAAFAQWVSIGNAVAKSIIFVSGGGIRLRHTLAVGQSDRSASAGDAQGLTVGIDRVFGDPLFWLPNCFGLLGEIAFGVVFVACLDAEFVRLFGDPTMLGRVFGTDRATVRVLRLDEVAEFVSGDDRLPSCRIDGGGTAGDGIDAGAFGLGLAVYVFADQITVDVVPVLGFDTQRIGDPNVEFPLEFVVVVDVGGLVAFAVGVLGDPVCRVGVVPFSSFGIGDAGEVAVLYGVVGGVSQHIGDRRDDGLALAFVGGAAPGIFDASGRTVVVGVGDVLDFAELGAGVAVFENGVAVVVADFAELARGVVVEADADVVAVAVFGESEGEGSGVYSFILHPVAAGAVLPSEFAGAVGEAFAAGKVFDGSDAVAVFQEPGLAIAAVVGAALHFDFGVGEAAFSG